jgi:hypothetical protein
VAILASAQLSDASSCSMACTGDGKETCGGPDRLSIWTTGGSGPKANPGVNEFRLLGCYLDSVDRRTLTHWVSVSGGTDAMSVSTCTASCLDGEYSFAGVEYGGGLTSSQYMEKVC